eukprot:TRINITY_DN1462_c0_g1_i9.p1 TRINITY_DN1462_c0_g1~~TRINITY_DN1462_c0_g1_i9.p1  ORF type:complete len:732 (+),score=113.65 TRINITY_DN1462_c0_g1_i9:92-2287(+)
MGHGEGTGGGKGSGKGALASKEISKSQEVLDAEPTDRGNWDNQCDFFLSCLGYAVGLGNVWRFPYLCYQHGGATFLIAYVVMLLVAGLPLFFLELTIGQYSGKGPIKLFGRVAPAMKGLGHAMLVITFLVVIYYNMIIAWTIFYTFMGFTSELPWSKCYDTDLFGENCYTVAQDNECLNNTQGPLSAFWRKECTPVEDLCQHFNMTMPRADERVCRKPVPPFLLDMEACKLIKLEPFKNGPARCKNGTNEEGEDMIINLSCNILFNSKEIELTNGSASCADGYQDLPLNKAYKRVTASEDYFKRGMLGMDSETTWLNMGGLKWELVLCLAGAWAIVCLCLIKGVQSSGKVVYFTALFPYLVLTILLIHGAMLEGAYKGIEYYVYPTADKVAKLNNVKVWSDAATQIFYSLGPSFGGLITLASYNRFDNNCHRDAILIAFANCGTSIFAGFVIFSIIGFMANSAGLEVEDVIKGGTGLAFIAYPDAVAQMPVPPLWSFLFFTMLITLGLDSQFTMTETVTTAVLDQWPKLRDHKGKVVTAASFVGFILGLSMCSRGGIFMFELINWYSASWSLLLLAIIEVILLMYGYGFRRVFENIEEMGMRLPKFMKWYWMATWLVLTPGILTFVLIMTFVQYTPAYTFRIDVDKYVFPVGIQLLGWLMALLPIVFIPFIGFLQYRKRKAAGQSTELRDMFSPNNKWGPAIETNSHVPKEKDPNSYINEGFKYVAETNYL